MKQQIILPTRKAKQFICLIVFSLFFPFSTFAQYTLTLNDVTFANGVITGFTNTVEKSIVIPDNFDGVSVTSIPSRVFSGMDLTSVVLPSTLTHIGDYAFNNNNLTSLTIPHAVQSIGGLAFYSNYLKSVTFEAGSNIKLIRNQAFDANYGLISILLPAHASDVFVKYGDGDGRNYQPGAQVTNFKTFYFALVPYTLTADDVTFVNGVITGFTNTVEKSIVIPDNFNGVNVTAIANRVFSGMDLTSVVLPSTLTNIGDYAFNNDYLVTLTIPGSVESIGHYAFQNCSLNSIYAYPTTPIDLSAASGVFYNVNKNTCRLYIPVGSKTAYRNAVQWKDFMNMDELITGIQPLKQSNIKVMTAPKTLIIENADRGNTVKVYSVSGSLVKQQVVANFRTRFILSPGIYVLHIGNYSCKVIIQ